MYNSEIYIYVYVCATGFLFRRAKETCVTNLFVAQMVEYARRVHYPSRKNCATIMSSSRKPHIINLKYSSLHIITCMKVRFIIFSFDLRMEGLLIILCSLYSFFRLYGFHFLKVFCENKFKLYDTN